MKNIICFDISRSRKSMMSSFFSVTMCTEATHYTMGKNHTVDRCRDAVTSVVLDFEDLLMLACSHVSLFT